MMNGKVEDLKEVKTRKLFLLVIVSSDSTAIL